MKAVLMLVEGEFVVFGPFKEFSQARAWLQYMMDPDWYPGRKEVVNAEIVDLNMAVTDEHYEVRELNMERRRRMKR